MYDEEDFGYQKLQDRLEEDHYCGRHEVDVDCPVCQLADEEEEDR